MEKVEKFIVKMRSIKEKLNSLENEFIELSENYIGNEFDDQKAYASQIENIILMLTHELSSQIEFGLRDLEILTKYIDFRKKYKEYSNKELSNIIDDNNLNIIKKMKLTNGKVERNISKIKSEWNSAFDNISYDKLTQKYLK